jgi:hypothetical protein
MTKILHRFNFALCPCSLSRKFDAERAYQHTTQRWVMVVHLSPSHFFSGYRDWWRVREEHNGFWELVFITSGASGDSNTAGVVVEPKGMPKFRWTWIFHKICSLWRHGMDNPQGWTEALRHSSNLVAQQRRSVQKKGTVHVCNTEVGYFKLEF